MTIGARAVSITIVAATLVPLAFSLRSAIVDGLVKTTDWVPLVESVVNDLVFATIPVVFHRAIPQRLERRSLLRLLHRRHSLTNTAKTESL